MGVGRGQKRFGPERKAVAERSGTGHGLTVRTSSEVSPSMRRRRWLVVLGSVLLVAGLAAWPLRSTLFKKGRRNAVPQALVETAKVPGYDVRYWGDELTPAFEGFVTKLYEQIKQNSERKIGPDFLREANFIAISGGGDNGALTAGIMKGWTERGDRPIFEAVTGVSTGALAAPFVFLGPAHDTDLADIYLNNSSSDLYTSRGLFGLLGNSLESTAPLEALIRRHATDAFLDEIAEQSRLGRRLLVASTNLDAQRPMIWDLTAVAASGRPDRRDLFVNILLASAAIPGIFPPVLFRVEAADGKTYTELHVDGGVTSEVIFVPPEAQLSELEKKIFGGVRKRTLWIIRNGKLGPEYAPSHDRMFALASRGVMTLVKYQVLANLHVLSREMQAGQSAFHYQGIPQAFNTIKKTQFDRAYAAALFRCGVEAGRAGKWSTDVPTTPIMVWSEPAKPLAQADDPIEKACRS